MNIFEKIKKGKKIIIAEAGVNHNGSIALGKKLIDAAKRAGADCIKFQTYKSEKLTTNKAKRFWNWEGEIKKDGTQLDSYSKLDKFNYKEYKILFNYCLKKNIEFQSTPFDLDAVDLLEKLGVKTYKIASCDINNFGLISKIAMTKKPIFLSTGASNIREIKDAIKIINKYHNKVVIMHCILCYPTSIDNINLNSINFLRKIFKNNYVGFSDHSLGIKIPIIAASMGATVIEKHFTINKKLKKSADHWLSVDEKELSELVRFTKSMNKILGVLEKKAFKCELLAKKYARRSLVAAKDIKKNEKFTLQNLAAKRPSGGMSPSLFFKLINKKSKKNYKINEFIKQ